MPSNDGNKQDWLRKLGFYKPLWMKLLVGLFAIYIFIFIPLPYYVLSAGSAESVKPMVTIKQGYPDEEGSLMLTTVRVGNTNLLFYLMALLHPNQELQLKSNFISKGESEEDYMNRQLLMMETSQQNAIEAAYHQAGVDFTYDVVVGYTVKNMPADQVLLPDDILLEIDDLRLSTNTDVINYLRTKVAGDQVSVLYKRKEVEQRIEIKLADFPVTSESEPTYAGLGLFAKNLIQLKPEDADKQVTILAGEIGGPSAGLIFALEIYNQLMPEDITKGYRIAGTGTIDGNGEVGVIGGIQYKVIAADREQVDIFFAPRDIPSSDTEQGVSNYSTAVNQALKMNSAMKIVEVSTIQDALDYLASLPLPSNP
jgi:PDZ domain-containing protein